jgi:hypothetical protein
MMEVETLPLDPGKIRAAGVVCCAACLLGAAGGGYLAVAGPVAGVEGFSYPHAVPGFMALQIVLASPGWSDRRTARASMERCGAVDPTRTAGLLRRARRARRAGRSHGRRRHRRHCPNVLAGRKSSRVRRGLRRLHRPARHRPVDGGPRGGPRSPGIGAGNGGCPSPWALGCCSLWYRPWPQASRRRSGRSQRGSCCYRDASQRRVPLTSSQPRLSDTFAPNTVTGSWVDGIASRGPGLPLIRACSASN